MSILYVKFPTFICEIKELLFKTKFASGGVTRMAGLLVFFLGGGGEKVVVVLNPSRTFMTRK